MSLIDDPWKFENRVTVDGAASVQIAVGMMLAQNCAISQKVTDRAKGDFAFDALSLQGLQDALCTQSICRMAEYLPDERFDLGSRRSGPSLWSSGAPHGQTREDFRRNSRSAGLAVSEKHPTGKRVKILEETRARRTSLFQRSIPTG